MSRVTTVLSFLVLENSGIPVIPYGPLNEHIYYKSDCVGRHIKHKIDGHPDHLILHKSGHKNYHLDNMPLPNNKNLTLYQP